MNSIMNYGKKKPNLLQGSEIYNQTCVLPIELIEIKNYFKIFF